MWLAVSGGADSLALLLLAVAARLHPVAVHVDHGLRDGSADDARVVGQVAAGLGVAWMYRRIVVAGGANLEARARRARYAALPAGVWTGHTADDQAETVLVNLLRGAAGDGLAGMSDSPRVHRPLLGLRRSETEGLCRCFGLAPVTDPSNQDLRFVRNQIRHRLLPLLAEVSGRDPVPILARQAGLLRADSAWLDAQAAQLDVTDARALHNAPPVLARRAVRAWLRGGAGDEDGYGDRNRARGERRQGDSQRHHGDGERHPPSAAEVDRVLAVAAKQFRACQLAGGRRVSRSGGRLRLEPSPLGEEGPPLSRVPGIMSNPGGAASSPAGHPGASQLDDPCLGEVVVSEEQLRDCVADLGARITADYQGRPPLLVGVLKGAFVFLGDLARTIQLPVEIDFMAVSSYGSSTRTSGVVRIVKDLDIDLRGRHVLIVEDIVDSGLTLAYLRRNLAARNPASLAVCALLIKEGLQSTDLDLAYEGFRIPPDFVVGYGLDVAERWRNLPFVCRYQPKVNTGGPSAANTTEEQ